jgi:hypothetical protein
MPDWSLFRRSNRFCTQRSYLLPENGEVEAHAGNNNPKRPPPHYYDTTQRPLFIIQLTISD